MLHAGRGIQKHNLILQEGHMAENRGKERILRAETPGARHPDATHDKQPEVICNRNGEAVNDIAHIRVEGEETARGNILTCANLFPEIFRAFRYRYYLPNVLWRNTERDCKVLLGIAIYGKNPQTPAGKKMGEDGGE
jgi:hypothetical protein